MKSTQATVKREDGRSRPARTVPDWITPELIEETLRVWQPYYASTLTAKDAAYILTGVGRLLETLTQPADGCPVESD